MADLRCKVGSIPLIVENIVSFCDQETKKSCRLVDSTWEAATNPQVWIRTGTSVEDYEDYEADPGFLALLDESLKNKQFRYLNIYNVVLPQLRESFGGKLKSLELNHVYFDSTAEMEFVLFNNFPELKVLTLDKIAVEKRDDRSPRGAFHELTPAIAQLDTLNIVIGDHWDWEGDTEPGLLVLGLDYLFQKFNMIKKLKFETGDYRPHPDVFAALSQANLAPETLQFHSWIWAPVSMADYLMTYGDRFLHFEGTVGDDDTELYKNVKVGSWLSVRMDRADWNMFGHGSFANLLKLKIMWEKFESFEFLCRMPVLKEIEFVERDDVDYEIVEMVTSLDRNPPCKTVTKIGMQNFYEYSELYFHVFPNLTQVSLSCTGQQFLDVVRKWPMLTKLHLWWGQGFEVHEVTRNVLHLEALEDFLYGSEALTFGDAEGEEFLFHPKLIYLRLRKISMSPLMVRLLKRKLVVFEFAYMNDIKQGKGDKEWLGYF